MKNKKRDKRGIAMPFNWLFAIIVGVIILFIAIYATAKIIMGSEYQIYTETAAKLDILLDPIRPGLASGKSEQINFKKETRTYYTCSDLGTFGKQTIAFSEKTFGDYQEKGGEINSIKYIFAEEMIEGKNLYLFSMPFEMPFKVDDLIFISGNEYCFYQAPNEIKEEIQNLNLKNIHFTESSGDKNCTGTKVCFGSKCEISVYGLCEDFTCGSNYDYGKVFKNNKISYYDDSLLYATIVSSPEIYECNVKRLMKKLSELADVYTKKIDIIEMKDCGSIIEPDLLIMMQDAKALKSSEDLYLLSLKAESIDKRNPTGSCSLY